MSEVTRYVLVDNEGQEQDYEYEYYQASKEAADGKAIETKQPWAVVERIYSYDDSELVYTTDGASEWK